MRIDVNAINIHIVFLPLAVIHESLVSLRQLIKRNLERTVSSQLRVQELSYCGVLVVNLLLGCLLINLQHLIHVRRVVDFNAAERSEAQLIQWTVLN